MTHYLPAYCEYNGEKRKAACGEWVTRADHDSEPTCDKCQTYVLADRETEHLTVEDVFGPPPESYPPKPVPFDCTGGRPRR